MVKNFKIKIEVDCSCDDSSCNPETLESHLLHDIRSGLLFEEFDLAMTGCEVHVKEVDTNHELKTIRVMISRLLRETKIVEVRAKGRDDINLRDVYAENCSEDDWAPDVEWGAQEGTHLIENDCGNFE